MPEQPGLRIEIERTKGRPEQLAAWRRLWMKLLAAPTTPPTADRPNEGTASIPQSKERIGYQDDEKNGQ